MRRVLLSRRELLKGSAATAWGLFCRNVMAAEPLALVVARDCPLSSVTVQELERLYRGDAESLGGRRVLPLNQPPKTLVRERFDRGVIQLDPEEVARYWINRRIRGQSGAPRPIPGRLMPAVVAKLPDAVGYVEASQVTAALKVVRVNDKLPQDPGYPLV